MTVQGSRFRPFLSRCWLPCLLFLASLLPRLCPIGRYITPDELAWVYRSVQLREALLAGRWAETLVSGHPGVTTTWLGALGISIQLLVRPADLTTYRWITQAAWLAPDNVMAFKNLAVFLTAGRVAVVLATSIGVSVIYLLARSLWGHRAALLGAAFLALDPFVVGLTGLLHVDGLAAILATLSLLALGLSLSRKPLAPAARWAAASGAAAALAVLSKSPAVALVPFSGLVLLSTLFARPRRQVYRSERWRSLLVLGVAWTCAFVFVALILLPALWAAPLDGVQTVVAMAGRHADEALRPVFFLGRAVLDPGPGFYPLALAFRLSPLVFVGLVAAFVMLLRGDSCLRSAGPRLLWGWAPLFIALISFGGKKFDRYALPAVPALALLAALAWDRLAGHRRNWLVGLLVAAQLVLLVSVLPYPLSAFNPLVGGSAVAQRVVPVGWGEEVSAAAHWLARRPGAATTTAAASIAPSLAPFFPGQTLLLDETHLPYADYLVLTAGARQLDPSEWTRLTAEGELVHTVRYSGLDQAWIFARSEVAAWPPVSDLAAPPSFDRRIQLRAVDVQATADRVSILVRWSLLQPGGRYTVQFALRDTWGHRWSALETPLLNAYYFFPVHWEPGQVAEVRYELGLPIAIAPADYVVELSLYDQDTGARLPLIEADGGFAGVVFSAERVSVPAPAEPYVPAAVDIPLPQTLTWFGGALRLCGSSLPPEVLPAGELATVTLFWQAADSLPEDVRIQFALADQTTATFPLSRFPSEAWRPGELVQERYSIPIPPSIPPGRYSLSVLPLDSAGLPLPGPAADLGMMEIQATERLFELPPDIPLPLAIRAGDTLELRGAALVDGQVQAGEQLALTLYWQVLRQPDDDWTTFVHLVAADDTNLAQVDRWPANQPSHTWAPGQVIIDEIMIAVPFEAPAGEYRLAVGLYQAASGRRLPLVASDGTHIADDRLFLAATIEVGP